MPAPNQISVAREDVQVTAAGPARRPEGEITQGGPRAEHRRRHPVSGGVAGGNGCVPIYNLMEDAATAEISRTQIWQWVRHGAKLSDGRIDRRRARSADSSPTTGKIARSGGGARFDSGNFERAARLFEEMSLSENFPEFLTVPAYDLLD